MTALVWTMAALAVALALFGTAAFLRLGSPLARLHAGSFVAAATGVPLAVAGFATDGVSARSLKLAALVAILIVAGAVSNHAIARALLYRGGVRR